MKKSMLALVLLLALALFAGCAPADGPGKGDPGADMSAIIDLLCQDVSVPAYEATPLTAEDFSYYAFIPYEEGLSGYQADALINSIPHSLVVLHSDSGDMGALAQEMLAAADQRKWICVGAEEKQAVFTEHYAVLIMSSKEVVQGILENAQDALADGEATAIHISDADAQAVDAD